MEIEQLQESLIKMWNTHKKEKRTSALVLSPRARLLARQQLVTGRIFTRRQQEDKRLVGKQLADLLLATAP